MKKSAELTRRNEGNYRVKYKNNPEKLNQETNWIYIKERK